MIFRPVREGGRERGEREGGERERERRGREGGRVREGKREKALEPLFSPCVWNFLALNK